MKSLTRLKNNWLFPILLVLVLTQNAHPAGTYSKVILPLFVGTQMLGEIPVRIGTEPGELELESKRTLELIGPLLDPLKRAELTGPSSLTLEHFRKAGLGATFDPSALEVHIEIPPQAALRQIHRIQSVQTFEPGTHFKPAALSGHLGINSLQDWSYGYHPTTQGRNPFRTDLDSALNYKSWVLESTGNYTEVRDKNLGQANFKRADTRLVKDWEEKMIRFQVGDLNYPVSGFQTFLPAAGLSASTVFGISPYQSVIPSGSHELLLQRRATVRVYVNGQHAKTLELEPGRHDLRDFSLSTGVNKVRLEITDDVGKTEILDFPFNFTDRLLNPGIHEISYNFGFRANDPGNRKHYESSDHVTSVSHRVGLTRHWTGEMNAQGLKSSSLAGLGSSYGTGFGTWSFQTAASRYSLFQNSASYGFGHELKYQVSDLGGPFGTSRSLDMGLEYHSPSFVRPSQSPASDRHYSVEGTLGINHSIGKLASFGLSHRRSNIGSESTSLSMARGWGDYGVIGLDTTLTISSTKDRTGLEEKLAYFLLTWALPGGNQGIAGSYTTQENATRAEWSYAPTSQVGGTNLNAGIDQSKVAKGMDLRAERTGNRYKLGFEHDSRFESLTHIEQHRTGLRAQTTLAFAGGKFGLARPIGDSFVLVDGIENLKNEELLLNPRPGGTYEASSDWMGPGILPNVTSYRKYDLLVMAPHAPPGVVIPDESASALPSYKSGILIQKGEPGKVLAYGILNKSLVSGTVKGLAPQSTVEEAFFTNRDGKFFIENLTPGAYFMTLSGGESFEFEIPANASGVFRIEPKPKP